jgi:ABC-type transporter Mla subunit MlaD
VSLAKSLNSALPPLNQRGDELSSVLDNLARLSNDTADLLNANRAFQDKAITEGGKTLNVLASRTGQLGPTIHGLAEYLQFQAILGHIPYGTTGSYLAGVKLVLGGGCLTGQGTGQGAGCPNLQQLQGQGSAPPAPAAAPAAAATPAPSPTPATPQAPLSLLPPLQTGTNAILSLLQGLLR